MRTALRRLGVVLLLTAAAAAARADDGAAPDGHRDSNIVSIGRDSNLPSGQQADSVVSIFGSSSSAGDATDVVAILGNTRVTGTVRDSAVAVIGNTYIDGKVDGDVVAVVGGVELGPHAEIGGDVVSVIGFVRRDPAAIVHGGVQSIFTGDFGNFDGLRAWLTHCLLYARPLSFSAGLGWAWGLALGFLALYAGLALLAPAPLRRCVHTFDTQPGQTLLAAIIGMLLWPVLIVLLGVTLIGIAAIPFVVTAIVCAVLFGKAVMLAWLGGRMTGGRATGALGHPAFAVLAGGAVVLALYLVPVLGFATYNLLGILGFGAVVYTLILALRARQGTTFAPASPRAAQPSASASRFSEGSPSSEPPPSAAWSAAAAQSEAPAATIAAATYSTAGADLTAGADTTAGLGTTSAADTTAGTGATAGVGATAAADTTAGTGATAGAGTTAGAGSTATAAGAGSSATAAGAGTPPRVTASLPRAGFWIRMAALLIDVLLVGFALSLLHHSSHLHLLVLGAYGAVMWKLRGSTVGGIVFDLRVVRLDGREIEWETAIVRALACFLSLAVAGLGFIWIAFDANNQAWHDKIAGTVVVRLPKGAPPP